MFLKRFIFVNWGNIPNLEFEFGPINLFSGGNGSGKTTAADAIQTVMTAAHENLFQYNPGQDETTQRGRGGKRVRTIASYVLGCDDGSYSRLDPTDGYLAAIFYPNEGESAEPFTAIIAVRAWLDQTGGHQVARQEDLQFYILPGIELGLDHFVREGESGKQVVPLTQLQNLLVKEFGKRSVERYDVKKAYLRRLYGALRGKAESVSDVEAVAAARAFSRFMAYKPVKSINRFVADEILEPKDLGEAIRSVSSQLKTIHGMERDAAHLVHSISCLDRAKLSAQLYIDHWFDLNLLDYTLVRAEREQRQRDYLRGKNLQKEKRQAYESTEQQISSVAEQYNVLQRQLIALEAQRQGIAALRKKDELEQQQEELNQSLIKNVKHVLEQDHLLAANLKLTEEIHQALNEVELMNALPNLGGLEIQAGARAVLDSAPEMIQDIHHLVQRDLVRGVSIIEERLSQLREVQATHNQWFERWHDKRDGQSARDQLAELCHARRTRLHTLNQQRDDKNREITRLSANQVNYPGYVERALKAIQQQCPQADPRVLCDHVEVTDPRWQAAIEGYLGGARFSILVDEDYEAEAIRIVRRLPGSDNRARVIQGSKALVDASKQSLASNSIIHVLKFSHAVARAYVAASYGTVQRVESAEELRMTRRGLTEDGMASGNYSMWRCDLSDSDLVFGVAARQRALQAKRVELEQIAVARHQAQETLEQAVRLLQAVDGLKHNCYSDVLHAVLSAQRQLEEVDNLLQQMDLSEHEGLEQRLEEMQAKSAAFNQEKEQLLELKGKLSKELEDIEKQLKALSKLQEGNQEQLDQHESSLAALSELWPDFDLSARLDWADQEAKNLNLDVARSKRIELEKALHAAERKTAEEIQSHNQSCRPADAIVYAPFRGDYDMELFKSVCDVRRDIDRVYNILKNNILVEKHAQLAELKEAFNNAFVSHLCHAIYQALGEGKRQIDLLNKELQHHRFGADRETFRFAYEWVPEYRDYARFFEEVVKTPGLGDDVSLFNAELSPNSAKVRDQMMAMLLSDDEQRAMQDLERVADYRNYRHYEIYKEVEGKEPIPLSEYGTGSGGQLETPAYIIRSAAITSAFRFAEGNDHLRMVLVDEAFSKMDETRSREVINYLTESLGLQLAFIMPTSKCGPYMELISNEFVFAKVPSPSPRGQLQTRVLVDRKQCNQEKIQALWANHRRMVYQQAELDFMEGVAG